MRGREKERVKEERVEGITERGIRGNCEDGERDDYMEFMGSRCFERI